MKLSKMFLENPEIFKQALNDAMIMKIATDSPQAGGVTIEMNSEEVANKVLHGKGLPVVCISNKGIQRTMSKGRYTFDYSHVGAKDYDEFKKKIKTSDNIASSADLYMFKIDGETLRLVDAESFKTSTSDSSMMIYLHNDADGSIHKGVESGEHPGIGQVLMLNFVPETGVCDVFYATGKMSDFTDLFKKSKEDNGVLTFHGKDLKDKTGMSQDSGLNRQLVKIINRKKKKKNKNGEDSASTSWTRGILVDRRFLSILANRGVIEKFYSFKVDFEKLEQDDWNRRYPQLRGE